MEDNVTLLSAGSTENMTAEPLPPSTGLAPYTGPWTEAEVIHLLKRCTFGAKRSDIAYFRSLTCAQAVDALLTIPPDAPAPPVKEYATPTNATTPDTNILQGNTWVNDPNTDGTVASLRRASFKKWWMGQMIKQDSNIREKMTLFWHNHFATESTDINAQFVYKHHALLRSYAIGNFKSLVKAVTLDPAMLVYLNGQLNQAVAPDENYGRELQELFCCGKGPGSQYTEEDVQEAARVLTGWRNNANTISSFYDNNRHDKKNKQFSSFYNNTIITGKNGPTAGEEELDELLNMIFATNEVAEYMCRRLYRWFVYYDIDDMVENNIIKPLAVLFRNANYEVAPVLRTLLMSEHFFDILSRGCQIKSPVDLVVGMCREFEIPFQPDTEYITNYGHWNYLVTQCSNLQQNIGDPPDVSGWKAYYQEPQFYEIWINSDTLPKRNQFTDTMVTNGYTFSGTKMIIDGAALAKTFSNPGDPNQLINDFTKLMYRIDLSDASKAQIKKDILLGGQSQDYYWTNAWDQFVNNPGDMANTTTVRNYIRDLLKYLMNLAEYQLA
ncbi:DUF1800 domain-containing protein [Sediminibacterium goheungense]|uniref:Uncharacterized protein (DUF1800 family) n=1 Tax=Sediminibacterium goheungense TaxID=1086393 RepID=A0A4R6IWE6_9BACT|nr:DUF1800 domain-containing protein [Sediminibacterium goheungense]TDO26697.1 uncharacterized protein (DUF1800 family) [Sediminibacterium goheungense]